MFGSFFGNWFGVRLGWFGLGKLLWDCVGCGDGKTSQAMHGGNS